LLVIESGAVVRIYGSARREIGGHMNGGREAAGGGEHGPHAGLAVLSSPSVGTPLRAADDQVTSFGSVRLARHRATGHARTRALWMRRYQHLLVAIDLIAAGIAVAVAFIVRFGIPMTAVNLRMYAIVGVLTPLAWVAVVAMNRAYEGIFVGAGPAEFDRLFKVFLATGASIVDSAWIYRRFTGLDDVYVPRLLYEKVTPRC
jgi:hypothetical protein